MNVGETGVAFFFVLSGFLLTWGYWNGIRPRSFYIRRLARIYPSHVVVWCVALVVPIVAVSKQWTGNLLNLLLLQAWVPLNQVVFSGNAVAWSLACEVAFYCAFPFLFRRFRAASSPTVVGITGSLLLIEGAVGAFSNYSGIEWLQFAAFASPPLRVPEFILGVAAGVLVRRGMFVAWPLRTVITIVAAVAFIVFHDRPVDNVWLALVYVNLIVFVVQMNLRQRLRLLTWKPLVYAGKVSFCFYLVHELVIINLLPWIGPGLLAAAVMVVVAAALAIVLHQGIEIPAQRYLVRRFDVAKVASPSDPVGT